MCTCPKIESVGSIKYLGAIIYKRLDFKAHIAYITRKARWGLYILSRLRNAADTKLLKILYYAFIESHLQYGISAWGGVYTNNLHSLILLQKRAIRIVTKSGYLEHTERLFQEQRILQMRRLYMYRCIIYALRRNVLQELPRVRSTRNPGYTYVVAPRITRYMKFFYIHIVKIVNAFPENFIDIRNKNEIKNMLFSMNADDILDGLHHHNQYPT
jgi:hypothetical protein